MYRRVLNEAIDKASIDTVFAMASNVATGAAKSTKTADDEYSYTSIAKAASKLVAVFPVLSSRTVSAETAHMVSKYIEQKACNLFTLALQQANINTAKSGIEYLRKFHQNLDVGGDNINAIINTMQTWVDAYDAGKVFTEGSVSLQMANNLENDTDYSDLFEADMDLEISSRDMAELMQVMKEMSEIQFYDTQLNPISINDYVVREFADGTYHVNIKPMEYFTEAKGGSVGKGLRDQYRRQENTPYDVGTGDNIGLYSDANRDIALTQQSDVDADRAEDERREDRDYTLQQRVQARRDRSHQQRLERRRAASEVQARRAGGNNVSLKDMDIKKMNDAVPSLLVVRFYQSDTASVATEFIIGVKSKLIPVTTTEVLRRIMNDNKDGKKFLNLMRMVTGELKKSEVIFGFSRIKDDLRSTKNKGAYGDIWNLLANRAKASSEAVKHGKHNDFSAITTVLISQADADELFREENFDITDPKNALHFMQSYNLMAFAIADDATETLKIMMDDGEKTFSEYAYYMFERESKDGTYKKLINLMAASK